MSGRRPGGMCTDQTSYRPLRACAVPQDSTHTRVLCLGLAARHQNRAWPTGDRDREALQYDFIINTTLFSLLSGDKRTQKDSGTERSPRQEKERER